MRMKAQTKPQQYWVFDCSLQQSSSILFSRIVKRIRDGLFFTKYCSASAKLGLLTIEGQNMRNGGIDYTLFVFLFIYNFVEIESECPEEWVEQNSRCYYFSFGQRPDSSWADAQSHCERMASSLVKINDAGENSYLLTQIEAQDMVWIGLNTTEDINVWKWVGELSLSDILFRNWGAGEPNGRDATDKCVMLVGENGFWFDGECSQNRSYICEMDLSVSNTTAAANATTSQQVFAATTVEGIKSTNAFNTADVTSSDSSSGSLAITTQSPVSDANNGSDFTAEIYLATTTDMDILGPPQTTDQGGGTVSSYQAITFQEFDETTVSRTDAVTSDTTQLGSTGIMKDYETGTVKRFDQSTLFEIVTTAILDVTTHRDARTVENVYETTQYDLTTAKGIAIPTDTNENMYGTTEIVGTSVVDFSIDNDLGTVTDIDQSTHFDLATTHTYDVTTYPDPSTVKKEYGTARLDRVTTNGINVTADTNDGTYVTTVLDTTDVANSSTTYQSTQIPVSTIEMFDITTYHSTTVESAHATTQYNLTTNKNTNTTDTENDIYETKVLDTTAFINSTTDFDSGTVNSIDQSTPVYLATETTETFDDTTYHSTRVESVSVYSTTHYDLVTSNGYEITTDIDNDIHSTTVLDTTAVINSSTEYDLGIVSTIDQSTPVNLAATEIFDNTTYRSTKVESSSVYGTTKYDLVTSNGNEITTDIDKDIYDTTVLDSTDVINYSTYHDLGTVKSIDQSTQVDLATTEIFDHTTYQSTMVKSESGTVQYGLTTNDGNEVTTDTNEDIHGTTELYATDVFNSSKDYDSSTVNDIDNSTRVDVTTNAIFDVTTYSDSSTVDNMYDWPTTQYDLYTTSVIDITTDIESNLNITTEFEIYTTEVLDRTMDIETSTVSLVDGTTMSEFDTTAMLNYATQMNPTSDIIDVGFTTDKVGIFESERTTDSVTTASSVIHSVSKSISATNDTTTTDAGTSTGNLQSATALQTTTVPLRETSSTLDASLHVTATVITAGQLATTPNVVVTPTNGVNTLAPSIFSTTPLKSAQTTESIVLTSLSSTVSSMTSDRSNTSHISDQSSSVPAAVTSLQPISSISTSAVTTTMITNDVVTPVQRSTTESASNKSNPGYTQMLFSMTLRTQPCTDAIKNVSSDEYENASQIFRTIISSIGHYLQIPAIEIDRLSFTCGSVIGDGIMQFPRSTTETAHQISAKFNAVIQDDLLPEIATYMVSGFDAADIDECNATDNFCHEFAICTNGDPGYTCQCQIGYSDEDPSLPGSSCRDVCLLFDEPYCENNGTCLRGTASSRPTCNCTTVFSGSRCENPGTEQTTTSESISSVSDMLSTAITAPHTSQIMVSASTKETLVPTSCSVKQSISGYTFLPTQPGLTTYSEEKCSNDENTALASILCLIEDSYDVTLLKVSNCRSIASVISDPWGNTTLEDLDFATANVSALNEDQVEQVVEYLNNISHLNRQYSQKEIMEATSIFSHISEYYNVTKVTAVERHAERQNLVRSFERISRHLDSGNISSVSVFTPHINVEVSDIDTVDTPYVFNATFYEDKTSNVTSYPMTITIPAVALTQARSLLSSLRVVSVGYRSSVLFPSEITTGWVISSSIGNSTHSLEGIALNDPVIIRSNNILEPTGQEIFENKKVVTSYECVFWDFNIGNWSTEGCSLLSSEPATCQCNHLTNFAILLSRVELPTDRALTIVTYIGVGLSILGLLLTLLIIYLSRRLRKKYQMQILGNICLSLATALTLFVSGVYYQVDTVRCSVLAVFMHFFFLATWTWTSVYSYSIYRDIAQVMASYGRRFKMRHAAYFGYGVPIVIVLLNAGITLGHIDRNVTGNATLESSYRSRNFCWLRHYSLYFGFLLPVALLLLFNVVVYRIVIPKITCKIAQIRSTKSKRSSMQNVVTSVCLATMMGLSWAFGYLMLMSEDPTFLKTMSWLFTITNSFQGAIIFYLTAIRTGELGKLFASQKTDLPVVSVGLSTADDKS